MSKPQINKLLIAALKPEWAFLKQDFTFTVDHSQKNLFYIKESPDTALLQIGLGFVQSQKTFSDFLLTNSCASVFHMGSSGALHSQLNAGDVFLADTFYYKQEKLEQRSQNTDALTNYLSEQNISLHSGGLLTVETALIHPQEKKQAAQDFSVKAVDMESFALAKLCQEHKIDYISVRGIFDTLDEDIETLGMPFDLQGNFETKKFVGNLVTHPQLILKLPELQKRHQKINQNLKKAVLWYVYEA